MDKKVIRAALLGFGTVGTGVYKVLQKQKEDMIPKLGSQIEIKKILVRNLEKAAAKVEDPAVLTNNWDEIVNDPEIDIVIELIGGIEPARSYILAAINAGKHVVTANKDLIAVHGKELLDAAEAHHVDFLFEAAVAGGIPIIRPLKECLAGNHMAEVMGIVNGTTNFILTKMTQDGMEFKDALALATAGLVGSDLANMINEAAINAVKNGRQLVNQSDLFEAFELVAVGGKEKKDRVMSDKERKIVSYHEVGHALVSALQKNTEPVQKITIVPRTMGALGYTLQTPEEEKYLETKDELLAKITTYMAGRAAEVLVFNSVTSGAANDIENATKIARAMVTMYGMSDKFGMMCLATVQNQYLEGGAGLICGENTASQIDDEVLSIINSSYAEAMKLLDENREILDSISDYLYEKETITGKEFMKMFRDMKGLPDPDEEKDGEESKEQENAQNDETSAADPLLRNATDQPADTNESSEYTAPDDTSNN